MKAKKKKRERDVADCVDTSDEMDFSFQKNNKSKKQNSAQ